MDNVWVDLHNTLSTSSIKTTSLFHNKGHWCSFIQKTQFSVNILGITRVSENSSVKKSTVNITNHGSNVTGGESRSRCSSTCTPVLNSFLHRGIPLFKVGFIEGDDGRFFWDFNIRVGKNEFTNILIKSKHVYTISKSKNKEGGGGVEAVGGGYKVSSRLEGVGKAAVHVFSIYDAVFIVLVDSNDGSGWDTGINVGGSIKRIENGNISTSFLNDEIIFLFVGISYKINRFIFFLRGKNTKLSSES